MDIEELIRYHGEGAYLDFKLKEYTKDNRFELVKDVMSLANSNYTGDRYIVIGIKKKVEGVEYHSIDNPKDGAEIQQTIHASIEPELDVEYRPFHLEGNNYVVLTVRNPTNQPYIAKSNIKAGDYKNGVTVGDCWVRKGEYKVRAVRKDFDRMYLSRLNEKYFNGDVGITFSASRTRTVTLNTIKDVVLPSVVAESRIRKIIAEKEAQLERDPKPHKCSPLNAVPLYPNIPYEQRPLYELRELLENVSNVYEDEDLYYFFEEKSHKINLCIINNGNEYVEDASIEVRMKRVEGLYIADKVYRLKESKGNPLFLNMPTPASYSELNYPDVDVTDEYFVIKEDIGSIKHHVLQDAFRVPFRLVIGHDIKEKEINVECTVRGKNLKEAIVRELTIQIERLTPWTL